MNRERIGTMARTSKKAKAVPVATVEEAADVDVRSVGETEAVAAVETGAVTASVAASGETVSSRSTS
jgi:ParB family chromosome partitioning protein